MSRTQQLLCQKCKCENFTDVMCCETEMTAYAVCIVCQSLNRYHLPPNWWHWLSTQHPSLPDVLAGCLAEDLA